MSAIASMISMRRSALSGIRLRLLLRLDLFEEGGHEVGGLEGVVAAVDRDRSPAGPHTGARRDLEVVAVVFARSPHDLEPGGDRGLDLARGDAEDELAERLHR